MWHISLELKEIYVFVYDDDGKLSCFSHQMTDRIGGGGTMDMNPLPFGPISLIFMQFSANILQNNKLAPPI